MQFQTFTWLYYLQFVFFPSSKTPQTITKVKDPILTKMFWGHQWLQQYVKGERMYHDKMFCLTPTIYFVLRQAFASTYLVKSFASERSKVHCTKSGDHLTYWPNKSYQSLVLLFEILTSEHLCFAKLWKRGIEFPCWGNVGNLWKRARFALNADLLQISILKFPRYFSTFNLFATVSRRISIQGFLSIKLKKRKWAKKNSFIFHLIYLLGWMGMWVKSVGLSSLSPIYLRSSIDSLAPVHKILLSLTKHIFNKRYMKV